MSDIDPFASAPDEAQTETPVTEPEAAKKAPAKKAPAKAAPATGGDPEAITTTFKGGEGFAAPWVVTRAPSIAEADALLGPDMLAYMEKVQRAGAKFAGLAPAKPAASGGGAQRSAPAGAAEPPAGSPEMPAGWTFRSGFNAEKGKAWKGYFPPRGSADKPIFF